MGDKPHQTTKNQQPQPPVTWKVDCQLNKEREPIMKMPNINHKRHSFIPRRFIHKNSLSLLRMQNYVAGNLGFVKAFKMPHNTSMRNLTIIRATTSNPPSSMVLKIGFFCQCMFANTISLRKGLQFQLASINMLFPYGNQGMSTNEEWKSHLWQVVGTPIWNFYVRFKWS